MEEDIKILEERIDYFKCHPEGCNWKLSFEDEKDIQALENLIKGYRELEIENQSYKDYLGTPPVYEDAKYIPKSKIKDKIEELETKLKVFEKDIRYCKDRVQARLMNDEIYVLRRCMDLLKELMEE